MKERLQWLGWGALAIGIAMGGCAAGSPPSFPDEPTSMADVRAETPDLAGSWEYEENNVVYTLTLDAQGNGTYDWQDGRFETRSVADGVWRGVWVQPKNDREGEFALKLSPDRQMATGRWWYTRIGNDSHPSQAGGTFTLRRIPGLDGGTASNGMHGFEDEEALVSE